MVNSLQLRRIKRRIKRKAKAKASYVKKFDIDPSKSIKKNTNNKSINYLLFSKKACIACTPIAGRMLVIWQHWSHFLRGKNAFEYEEKLTVDNRKGIYFNKTLFNIDIYESFTNRAPEEYCLPTTWLPDSKSEHFKIEREKP